MTNFIVLLKENFIEIVRSKKIFVFSFVFTFLSVISAFTAKYLPLLFEALLSDVELGGMYLFEATVANSYVQFISNFGQISVLLICVMFCGSIVKFSSEGQSANTIPSIEESAFPIVTFFKLEHPLKVSR